ncbi:NAD(P)-binding domain-containing protein [Streptomyces sp. NPDC050507]|uniref:NAD(P)-binding domain-containing protein n=1 Tax=Streptomyces sp. NPDC050507 TaxID=3365619 RepID=UPI00378C6B98
MSPRRQRPAGAHHVSRKGAFPLTRVSPTVRKLGILGTGNIGKTLTRRLSAAGHEVKAGNPSIFAQSASASPPRRSPVAES